MSWFWMNIPLMLVFFGCWAGIPLWLVLTRWDKEIKAKHAEVAAWHAHVASSSAVPVQPTWARDGTKYLVPPLPEPVARMSSAPVQASARLPEGAVDGRP